jgi:hypothetical protein
MMSLPGIRQSIMSIWRPPEGVFARYEERSIDRLVLEIQTAEKVGLWSAVPVSTGKIIEALLRKKLQLEGAGEAAAKLSGLGQLIELAKKRNVLRGYDKPRRGSSSLGAAAILRNWEAHFNTWDAEPSELRAAQSQALLVCATEALFPTALGDGASPTEADRPWRELSATKLVSLLTKNHPEWSAILLRDFMDVARHIARQGSLRVVHRFEQLVQERAMPRIQLAKALESEFGSLVRHSCNARAKNVLWTIDLLKRLDLREHARTFGILLPLDDDVFRHLLRRSPAAAVFYIAASHRAEAAVFTKRMSTILKDEKLVEAFWTEVESRWGLGNVGDFLFRIPQHVRARLLRAAKLEYIRNALANVPLNDRVKVLRMITERMASGEPLLAKMRAEAVESISTAVADATLAPLHGFPHLMKRSWIIDGPAGIRLLSELLQSLQARPKESEEDWYAFARVVWDANLYSARCRDLARQVAVDTLESETTVPPWAGLWMTGMLSVAGRTTNGIAADTAAWQIADDDPNLSRNRWYVYAVALGLATVGNPIPARLATWLEQTIQPAETSDQMFTVDMVGRIYALLNQLRAPKPVIAVDEEPS